MSNVKNLVENIVKSLVDKIEEVSVKEVSGDSSIVVIEISTNKEDVGKLIGKQGRTASAIRTIVNAASVKDKTRKKYIIEVLNQ